MICMECKELVKPDWFSHEDENGNLICLDCDNRDEVSEEMFGCSIPINKSFVVDRYPHFCIDLKGNRLLDIMKMMKNFILNLKILFCLNVVIKFIGIKTYLLLKK